MKIVTVLIALLALAFTPFTTMASSDHPPIRIEGDGHHHFKLHIPEGYYITHQKLEELCHESKDEVLHHAEAAMHKLDGAHDGHNQKVSCDGGHSLETIHDAH